MKTAVSEHPVLRGRALLDAKQFEEARAVIATPAKAHAAHEARVASFFSDKPPGKLLDLDVFSGQGWPELCAFLGKPVRDEPFPYLNRGASDDGE